MVGEIEKHENATHGDTAYDDAALDDTTPPSAAKALEEDTRLQSSETSVGCDGEPPADKKTNENKSPGRIGDKDDATSSSFDQANVELAIGVDSFINKVDTFVPDYLLDDMDSLKNYARRFLFKNRRPIKRYVSLPCGWITIMECVIYTRNSR